MIALRYLGDGGEYLHRYECLCTRCNRVFETTFGCLRRIITCRGCATRAKLTTHGGSHSPEYAVWNAMLRRCLSKTNASYPDYGGRGITVAPEWIGEGGFERFLAHIGPRPPKHLIDRKDNDRGYEPGNVRWATYAESNRNRRPMGTGMRRKMQRARALNENAARV